MLTPGQTIGRFEVRAPLGQGGMGAVYLALDPSLGREVALKVMHEDLTRDAVAVQRFRREALALAKPAHPGVVRIFDLVEVDGQLVLVMEHLAGESLRQRMGAGRLPVAEAVALARDLLAALEAAHGLGVLHRDLKPGNVFVTARGEAKLLDFGVARLTDATRLTETGELLGTVRYMAPELLRGLEPGRASDVYAVGAILFEMLAGRSPYEGTGVDLIVQIRAGAPPRLGDVAPEVPPEIAAAVDRALSADPAARFESADAFLRALPEGARQPSAAAIAARPPPDAPRATPPRVEPLERTRSQRAWPIAAAVVVLGVVGVAGAALLATATAPARRRSAEVRTLTLPDPPAPSGDAPVEPPPTAAVTSSAPPAASSAPRAPQRVQLFRRGAGCQSLESAACDRMAEVVRSRAPAIRQCVERSTERFDFLQIYFHRDVPPRCELRDPNMKYHPFPCCQAAVADVGLPTSLLRYDAMIDVKRSR